jgi:adenylate cyclase class IV
MGRRRDSDLGQFVELEVVLTPEQPGFEGVNIAEALMAKLGIEESHLLPCAYVDLLQNTSAMTARS